MLEIKKNCILINKLGSDSSGRFTSQMVDPVDSDEDLVLHDHTYMCMDNLGMCNLYTGFFLYNCYLYFSKVKGILPTETMLKHVRYNISYIK